MNDGESEIARRRAAAFTAIKHSLGDNESAAAMFVSHHAEKLEAAYWDEYVGTSRPTAKQSVDLLRLQTHWADVDEQGIETFDFTLPGDVTNYVISVRFNADGEVEGLPMKS